jgi:hypothetical protein
MPLSATNISHQSSCSQTCSEVIFEKASLGLVLAPFTYKRMGRERPLRSEEIFCQQGELENYTKWTCGLFYKLFTHRERFLKYCYGLSIMESIRPFVVSGCRPNVYNVMIMSRENMMSF